MPSLFEPEYLPLIKLYNTTNKTIIPANKCAICNITNTYKKEVVIEL